MPMAPLRFVWVVVRGALIPLRLAEIFMSRHQDSAKTGPQ
jgi:hypothetical protein